MTLPRKSGGLGLLNPFVLQATLQLRWVLPLLRVSNLTSSFWSAADLQQSIVLLLLADYLLHHLELASNVMPFTSLVSDFRLCFLFPSLLPSSILDRDNPLYLLFKVIGMLPRDFAHVVINPETAFQLAIRSIVTTEPSLATRASMFNLAVCDAYLIDRTTHIIRPRTNRELLRSPLLVKLFLKAVRNNLVQLAPFFLRTCIEPRFAHLSTPPYVPATHRIIDAQPFLDSCSLASQGKDISSKAFRIRCTYPPHKDGYPFGNTLFSTLLVMFGIGYCFINCLVGLRFIDLYRT
ncbi:MAG: hypothetical protein EXX96DRAFT_159989 [Benjaminiella poitrasii]|nr:MAG: hypothetical protein EXX96DRAFT_159989 [Benjaminiella poitrasii]